MASRAPHPLAEAICELAAPPGAPTYLRLQAYGGDNNGVHAPSFAVLLHLRPRHHAAGLEIAVHCAMAEAEEDGFVSCTLAPEAGVLYAVPQTAAGIDGFVQDLINTGSWEFQGDTRSLRLHTRPNGASWSKVQLQLCAAAEVGVARGPDWVRLRFPPLFSVSALDTICPATVLNDSVAYDLEQREGAQPKDSKEVFQRTFRELRDSAWRPRLPACSDRPAASAAARPCQRPRWHPLRQCMRLITDPAAGAHAAGSC